MAWSGYGNDIFLCRGDRIRPAKYPDIRARFDPHRIAPQVSLEVHGLERGIQREFGNVFAEGPHRLKTAEAKLV